MKLKVLVRCVFQRFIQYLNIGLFVSGRVMAVTGAGLSLLIFSKQLFLVKNQAAWSMALLIAFGIAILNLLLTFPVFILALKMKCPIPKIKRMVCYYLIAEYLAVLALMLLTKSFFAIYTGGEDFVTWQGDQWWVFATKMPWRISWCTGLTSVFQFLLWGMGSGVKEGSIRQGDGSSVLTEFGEGDDGSQNNDVSE